MNVDTYFSASMHTRQFRCGIWVIRFSEEKKCCVCVCSVCTMDFEMRATKTFMICACICIYLSIRFYLLTMSAPCARAYAVCVYGFSETGWGERKRTTFKSHRDVPFNRTPKINYLIRWNNLHFPRNDGFIPASKITPVFRVGGLWTMYDELIMLHQTNEIHQ